MNKRKKKKMKEEKKNNNTNLKEAKENFIGLHNFER